MELKQSKIIFNENDHSYITPNGESLSGITGMIDRQIFGGKYEKIDKEFLRPYAEYGSQVHKELDEYFTVGIDPVSMEACSFLSNFTQNGTEISEYLVSDNKNFATKIDLLNNISGKYYLYDFKTTNVLDIQRISWQLSISAYLFFLQNGFYPDKLFAVHLRGEECEFVEIEMMSEENVTKLLEAEINGYAYFSPSESQSHDIANIIDFEEQIISLKQSIELFENRKRTYLDNILKQMDAEGMKKIETERVIITRVDKSVKKSFDSKKLKKDFPDICKDYEQLSEVNGYVKIKLK